jgi:hypothetical protein
VDLIDSISIDASKTLIAGKTLHGKKERPGTSPSLLANSRNLAMMMTMMVATMVGCGISRNNRPSQNDERNGSKK